MRKNPTRLELAERFRRLIEEYNAGTHSLEDFLRRLKTINDELTDEEQRPVREGATEAELAVFDLLTKPGPHLTEAEAKKVRGAAKKVLEHVEDKLVLDWKRRQQTRSAVRVAVGTILDKQLPDIYGRPLFHQKADAIFDHIYASYFDNGASVYDTPDTHTGTGPAVAALPTTAEEISDDLLIQVRTDPELFARLIETVFGASTTWACPTQELLIDDETRAVEYKQTARWNVRKQRRDKTMEQVIVKTVAGLLNDRGGTLLIGVTDNREPVGLDNDYTQVKPPNADGYVNWLDTLFEKQPRPRRRKPPQHPHRPNQQPRHLPHRHPRQLPPHMDQDQKRRPPPLPTPQQLNPTSTSPRDRNFHHRKIRAIRIRGILIVSRDPHPLVAPLSRYAR